MARRFVDVPWLHFNLADFRINGIIKFIDETLRLWVRVLHVVLLFGSIGMSDMKLSVVPVLHHNQAALGVRVSAREDELLDVGWDLAPETRESAQEGRDSTSVAIPLVGGKARHTGGGGRAAAVGAQSRVDAHDAVVNEREREGVAGKQTVRCYQVESRRAWSGRPDCSVLQTQS